MKMIFYLIKLIKLFKTIVISLYENSMKTRVILVHMRIGFRGSGQGFPII